MFSTRSCHKRRMTNYFTYQKPLSLDRFEQRFPDDDVCADDLFRRRWPEADVGDGRDIHESFALVSEEQVPGFAYDNRAFERDVVAPAPGVCLKILGEDGSALSLASGESAFPGGGANGTFTGQHGAVPERLPKTRERAGAVPPGERSIGQHDTGKTRDTEFGHQEAVAFLQSLPDEEAAKHSPFSASRTALREGGEVGSGEASAWTGSEPGTVCSRPRSWWCCPTGRPRSRRSARRCSPGGM